MKTLQTSDPGPAFLPLGINQYDAAWPGQFELIKKDLQSDLADGDVSYLAIEHVGSTSIPGCWSKAIFDNSWEAGTPPQSIIDICVFVKPEDFTQESMERFKEALGWGRRQPGYYCIGNGGVNGRWSFKLNGKFPLRNVYVAPMGGIQWRSYIDLRDTLRGDGDLRDRYSQVKAELVKEKFEDVLEYSYLKRPMIREIFKKAGWTDREIDFQESQSKTSHREARMMEY